MKTLSPMPERMPSHLQLVDGRSAGIRLPTYLTLSAYHAAGADDPDRLRKILAMAAPLARHLGDDDLPFSPSEEIGQLMLGFGGGVDGDTVLIIYLPDEG